MATLTPPNPFAAPPVAPTLKKPTGKAKPVTKKEVAPKNTSVVFRGPQNPQHGIKNLTAKVVDAKARKAEAEGRTFTPAAARVVARARAATAPSQATPTRAAPAQTAKDTRRAALQSIASGYLSGEQGPGRAEHRLPQSEETFSSNMALRTATQRALAALRSRPLAPALLDPGAVPLHTPDEIRDQLRREVFGGHSILDSATSAATSAISEVAGAAKRGINDSLQHDPLTRSLGRGVASGISALRNAKIPAGLPAVTPGGGYAPPPIKVGEIPTALAKVGERIKFTNMKLPDMQVELNAEAQAASGKKRINAKDLRTFEDKYGVSNALSRDQREGAFQLGLDNGYSAEYLRTLGDDHLLMASANKQARGILPTLSSIAGDTVALAGAPIGFLQLGEDAAAGVGQGDISPALRDAQSTILSIKNSIPGVSDRSIGQLLAENAGNALANASLVAAPLDRVGAGLVRKGSLAELKKEHVVTLPGAEQTTRLGGPTNRLTGILSRAAQQRLLDASTGTGLAAKIGGRVAVKAQKKEAKQVLVEQKLAAGQRYAAVEHQITQTGNKLNDLEKNQVLNHLAEGWTPQQREQFYRHHANETATTIAFHKLPPEERLQLIEDGKAPPQVFGGGNRAAVERAKRFEVKQAEEEIRQVEEAQQHVSVEEARRTSPAVRQQADRIAAFERRHAFQTGHADFSAASPREWTPEQKAYAEAQQAKAEILTGQKIKARTIGETSADFRRYQAQILHAADIEHDPLAMEILSLREQRARLENAAQRGRTKTPGRIAEIDRQLRLLQKHHGKTLAEIAKLDEKTLAAHSTAEAKAEHLKAYGPDVTPALAARAEKAATRQVGATHADLQAKITKIDSLIERGSQPITRPTAKQRALAHDLATAAGKPVKMPGGERARIDPHLPTKLTDVRLRQLKAQRDSLQTELDHFTNAAARRAGGKVEPVTAPPARTGELAKKAEAGVAPARAALTKAKAAETRAKKAESDAQAVVAGHEASRSAPPAAAGGKWTRVTDGYRRGTHEIHDNGGGMGPARGSGRWAVSVGGKWKKNIDSLAEAKAFSDSLLAKGAKKPPKTIAHTAAEERLVRATAKREAAERVRVKAEKAHNAVSRKAGTTRRTVTAHEVRANKRLEAVQRAMDSTIGEELTKQLGAVKARKVMATAVHRVATRSLGRVAGRLGSDAEKLAARRGLIEATQAAREAQLAAHHERYPEAIQEFADQAQPSAALPLPPIRDKDYKGFRSGKIPAGSPRDVAMREKESKSEMYRHGTYGPNRAIALHSEAQRVNNVMTGRDSLSAVTDLEHLVRVPEHPSDQLPGEIPVRSANLASMVNLSKRAGPGDQLEALSGSKLHSDWKEANTFTSRNLPTDGSVLLIKKGLHDAISDLVRSPDVGNEAIQTILNLSNGFRRVMLNTRPGTYFANLFGNPQATALMIGPRAAAGALVSSVSHKGYVGRLMHEHPDLVPSTALHSGTVGRYVTDRGVGVESYMSLLGRGSRHSEDVNKIAVYLHDASKYGAQKLGIGGPRARHEFLKRVLGGDFDAMKIMHDLAGGKDPRVHDFLGHMEEVFGKSKFGVGKYDTFAGIALTFPQWFRHMAQLTLLTLPFKYPGRMVILQQLARLGDEYRGHHGLWEDWNRAVVPLLDIVTHSREGDHGPIGTGIVGLDISNYGMFGTTGGFIDQGSLASPKAFGESMLSASVMPWIKAISSEFLVGKFPKGDYYDKNGKKINSIYPTWGLFEKILEDNTPGFRSLIPSSGHSDDSGLFYSLLTSGKVGFPRHVADKYGGNDAGPSQLTEEGGIGMQALLMIANYMGAKTQIHDSTGVRVDSKVAKRIDKIPSKTGGTTSPGGDFGFSSDFSGGFGGD